MTSSSLMRFTLSLVQAPQRAPSMLHPSLSRRCLVEKSRSSVQLRQKSIVNMSRRTLHLRGVSSLSTSASQTTTTPFPLFMVFKTATRSTTTSITPRLLSRLLLRFRAAISRTASCQTRQLTSSMRLVPALASTR